MVMAQFGIQVGTKEEIAFLLALFGSHACPIAAPKSLRG
jgi:hypothetical protein